MIKKKKFKSRRSTSEKSRFLLLGSAIALTIAFSPYIFYLYEIFPNGPVWETSLFTYESRYYKDVMTAAWTFFGKITPLVLLLIWFFTCKHWWYHAILVPIIMYAYQLIFAIRQDISNESFLIDSDQLIYLAPFFIVILCLVYLIRLKIFDRIYGIDLSEIERDHLSPFSPLSDKDYEEVKSFREQSPEDEEKDYYAKL